VALGAELAGRGWAVRGSTRDEGRLAEIETAGLEPVLADPDRVGTVLEQVEGVTVVFWLMGTAAGSEDEIAAVHGPRLERMLEKLVDSPVRGFVYESAGTVGEPNLSVGARLVAEAAERWRIPVRSIDADPRDRGAWLAAMAGAADELVGT
jgi:nucleoside-diphosphate-sugar epimerase